MQPKTNRGGLTGRKQINSKELTMAFDSDLVPIAGIMVPIVGSIAFFSFLAVAAWAGARRKEREAYYTSETLKKIAESSAEGASSALQLLREQEKNAIKRRLEGTKLGGLITVAVGIGLIVLLRGIEHDEPVYLAGMIPLLIGVAMLAYAYMLAPKEKEKE
jgi:hypothetical protein